MGKKQSALLLTAIIARQKQKGKKMKGINFLETIIGVAVCFGVVWIICAVVSVIFKILGVN